MYKGRHFLSCSKEKGTCRIIAYVTLCFPHAKFAIISSSLIRMFSKCNIWTDAHCTVFSSNTSFQHVFSSSIQTFCKKNFPRVPSVWTEYAHHYTRTLGSQLHSTCAPYTCKFWKSLGRLSDTASEVNFICKIQSSNPDRSIVISSLLHNNRFFGNYCNIYRCQVTAYKSQLLSFLVKWTKRKLCNMNICGIECLYSLLY